MPVVVARPPVAGGHLPDRLDAVGARATTRGAEAEGPRVRSSKHALPDLRREFVGYASTRAQGRSCVPESGLPIRVYIEQGMWHVDYGEGEVEVHVSREDAESAADAVAAAEERTVVVEE
jgi:hypothetical protein